MVETKFYGIQFRTVIYNSAESGNLARIKVFAESYKHDPDWVNDAFNIPIERDPEVLAGNIPPAVQFDASLQRIPLVIAARRGHTQTVEYMLDIGVDPHIQGSVEFDNDIIQGTPALWAAAAAGHLDIVKLLVEKANADVNQATNTQSTPLRGACYDGHLDIVRYLLEHGANPHIPNRHGHTCLMIAAYRNKVEVVRELLKTGIDVNVQTERGNSALHDAAESGNVEVVNMLFAHGAKMLKDMSGVDPLICAAQSGAVEVVEVLAERVENRVHRRDAFKMLGATLIDKKMDHLGAIEWWKRAIQVELSADERKLVREVALLVDTLEVYDHEREIQTLAEVDALEGNSEGQRMQALVIRERILGGAHADVHYYLRFRGAVYCDVGQMDKCYELWKHALDLQQRHFTPLHSGTVTTLQSFQETFSISLNDYVNAHQADPNLRVKTTWVEYVFDRVCHEMERVIEWGNRKLMEETECCGKAQCIHSTPEEETKKLVVITVHLVNILERLSLPSMATSDANHDGEERRVVKLDLERFLRPCRIRNVPFLHYALSEAEKEPASLPKASVLSKFIVFPGIDVNARDENGNTPLHIILKSDKRRDSLVALLLRHGAHLLARNNEGKVVWDMLKEQHVGERETRELHRMLLGRYLTLGGIVANQMRVRYQDKFVGVEKMLPRELVSFYLTH